VDWDIRKADPYCVYDRFEFDIPTGSAGDCYDRYRVRVAEMRQSLLIIEQAVEQMSPGEVLNRMPLHLKPPAGEAYARIEAPKGELGFFLVSDGSDKPYRFHIRAPSLLNLTVLREMVIGWKIADVMVTLGSIDICLGEVDR
jgi:NADH-quinone oxidoreductase subunit D